MDAGFLDANPVPEVAVSDQTSGNILVFRGGGAYAWLTSLSGDCGGLKIGNLFSNAYEILVWMDTDDDIRWLDHIGGGGGYLPFSTDYVRSFHLVDLVQTDALDELVINLKNTGVVAYDFASNIEWTYEAPLVLDEKSAYSIFRDVNADGQIDLIFTNYDYINVVDGGTARLLWHYKDPDMRRIAYPSVGAFYEPKEMDVVYIGPHQMRLVAHSLSPPIIPAGAAASNEAFIDGFVTTLLFGSALAFVALVVPIRAYRKREEEK
jgi:hypothetical protein